MKKENNKELDLNLIKSIFFVSSPIIIEPKLEGMKVENSQLFLGCRAGPEVSPDNLFHEMSHLIDIDDKRILMPGWGLTYHNVNFVYDREVVEPLTSQATHREMRVFAIQKHLSEIANYSDIDSWEQREKILHWMIDYPMIDSENNAQYCINMMDSYYQKYTKDSILKEWNRKNSLLSR